MQRKQQSSHPEASLFQHMVDTFHQGIVSRLLERNDVTIHNWDTLIRLELKMLILHLFIISPKYQPVITLLSGEEITEHNCPLIFEDIFEQLIQIKREHELVQKIDGWLLAKLNQCVDSILGNKFLSDAVADAKRLVLSASQSRPEPQFQSQPNRGFFSSLFKPAVEKLSSQLVRDSFHHQMTIQGFEAVDTGWILFSDLEKKSSFIFFALPAFTLIDTIQLSRGCHGIQLLEGKTLTAENCPSEDGLKEFFTPIIKLKTAILALSPDQLALLKHMCLLKDDVEIPDSLLVHTADVSDIAERINEVTSQVTCDGVFQQTVLDVMKLCVNRLRAQAPKPSGCF